MKTNVTIFLLGALLGAAVALSIRAVVAGSDEGGHGGHGAHGGPAMDMPAKKAGAPAGTEVGEVLIDLGNETCPIMGNGVNGKTFTEWNGLRIGHCCPPCSAKLLKDPERLLDEAGIEWREAAKLAAGIAGATGPHREMLIASASERFTVVRKGEDSR